MEELQAENGKQEKAGLGASPPANKPPQDNKLRAAEKLVEGSLLMANPPALGFESKMLALRCADVIYGNSPTLIAYFKTLGTGGSLNSFTQEKLQREMRNMDAAAHEVAALHTHRDHRSCRCISCT